MPKIGTYLNYLKHRRIREVARRVSNKNGAFVHPNIYNVIGNYEIFRKGKKIERRERTGINDRTEFGLQKMIQIPTVVKFTAKRNKKVHQIDGFSNCPENIL